MPERDLPVVAGQDVQADDGDEVDADEREPVVEVVVERLRQETTTSGTAASSATRQPMRAAPNGFRRASRRPGRRDRPAGRSARASAPRARAAAAAPSRGTTTRNRTSRLIPIPMMKAPTTAPTGLSIPPSTAAAKAYVSRISMKFGVSSIWLAAIIPETALSIAARPQPMLSIERDADPDQAARRRADRRGTHPSPSRVKRKKTKTIATQTSDTPITPRSWTFITTSPTSNGLQRERALQELDLRRPDPAGQPVRG